MTPISDCLDAYATLLQTVDDLEARLTLVDEALEKVKTAVSGHNEHASSAAKLAEVLAHTLELPTIFAHEDWSENPDRPLVEAQWRAYGLSGLSLLHHLLGVALQRSVASDETCYEAFIASARFLGDGLDPWVTPVASQKAHECLRLVTAHSEVVPLVQRVLLHNLKPIFLSRPHTAVNPSTGRALPRPRGGPGYADFSSEQDWKGRKAGAVGSWNILAACLHHLGLEHLESCWHLLVPPLMTIMDDHETPFRLRGIRCMRILLNIADLSLLRRTGLDSLLQQSLTTSLSFMSFAEHAPLIEAALEAYLALIDKLYPRDHAELSEVRFDALCTLMQSGPLAVWTYAIDKPAFVRICVHFLPSLFEQLGVMTVRFLDSLIPPLSYILRFPGLTEDLYIATACALEQLLQTVRSVGHLLGRWRGTVLAAVGMCCEQSRGNGRALTAVLRKVVIALLAACPSEVQHDLSQIRSSPYATPAIHELFAAA